MKICNVCKKEVPDDSHFCQYCGSKDVIDKVEENVSLTEEKKKNRLSFKSILVFSILVLSLVCNLYMMNQITELKKSNATSNDKVDKYYAEKVQEEYKYSKLRSSLEDIVIYDKFYVNKPILFSPSNEKILVTFEHDSAYEIYSRSSSSSVTTKWGDWIDNYTCELFITCKSNGLHDVEITNNVNNQILKIIIINE